MTECRDAYMGSITSIAYFSYNEGEKRWIEKEHHLGKLGFRFMFFSHQAKGDILQGALSTKTGMVIIF